MNAQFAHDALLEWCSEMGRGTFEVFRKSCRHLRLDPSTAVRVLSQLGHVEFDLGKSTFAAAKTSLIAIPGLPGRMMVSGARPRGMFSHIVEVTARSDLDFDVPMEPCHQFGNAPSSVLVEGDPADAAAFCQQAGIAYAAYAHDAIAALLPAVTIATATVAHRPDPRFPHAFMDPHTFQPRWDLGIPEGRPGLWLYRSWGWTRKMILQDDSGEPRMVIDGDYAPFLVDRPDDADPIVEYKEAHNLMIVNAATPLPGLHARAACLCSGRAPIRHHLAPGVAVDHFVNVDAVTAGRILQSLGVKA